MQRTLDVGNTILEKANKLAAAIVLTGMLHKYVSEEDVTKAFASLTKKSYEAFKAALPEAEKAVKDFGKFGSHSYQYSLDLIKHLASETPITYIEKDKRIGHYSQLVPAPPQPDESIGKKAARNDIGYDSEEYKKFDGERHVYNEWLHAKQRWEQQHPQGQIIKEYIPIHEKDLPNYPEAQQIKDYLDDPYYSLEAIRARDAAAEVPFAMREPEREPVVVVKEGASGAGKKKPDSAWVKFVKAYAKKHDLSFFKALKPAHLEYSKKKTKGGGYFSDLARKHNVVLH